MDWNGSGSLGSIEHFSSKYKHVCFIGPALVDVSAFREASAHGKSEQPRAPVGQISRASIKICCFKGGFSTHLWEERNENMNLTQAVCSRNNGRHAALSISHSFTSWLEQTLSRNQSQTCLDFFSGFPLFHSISISIPGTGPPEICHLKSAIFAHGTTDVFEQITWDAMWPISLEQHENYIMTMLTRGWHHKNAQTQTLH